LVTKPRICVVDEQHQSYRASGRTLSQSSHVAHKGPACPCGLKRDIDIFIKQESNHYRLHNRFNEFLYSAGYHKAAEIETTLGEDYRMFLRRRSLKFNAAYCAGFENLSLFIAKFLFDEADEFFAGGVSRVVDLFRWHYAEEYEHRTVCHAAFAAISGNYFLRVYGAVFALIHLTKYKKMLEAVVLGHDRRDRNEFDRHASVKRENAFSKRMSRYTLPRMLQILLPFYDPNKQKPGRGMEQALSHYQNRVSPPA
jgi:predicted metal-dependent hydrolase